MACGTIGGQLIAVGAGDDRTFAFDFLSSTWRADLAPRPFPGGDHAAAVLDGKLVLFGGLGMSAGKVQIYDPVTDLWSVGADMSWLARGASCCVLNGQIHVAGGVAGGLTVPLHSAYDLALDTWTPQAPMTIPGGVAYAAGASDGTHFYVFGGRGGDGSPAPGLGLVQVFELTSGTWQTSADVGTVYPELPAGRAGTGAALWYKGEFYVFGGETSDADPDPEATPDKVFAQVQVWNPTTLTWRREADMKVARHGLWPVTFEGRAFLACGGEANGDATSAVVEVFSRQ
ncbi:MAG: hypothetical protein KUG81_05485, partial [Gammaproteobacteria bacterium]|nr:hypothetical protein [Gammaproteobacteria bacterium]